MTDHARYEELAVLAAGGHLSAQEQDEFQRHLEACDACREDLQAYGDLLSGGLPLTRTAADVDRESALVDPVPGARERFLARAAGDGARFSNEATGQGESRRRLVPYRSAGLLAAAAALILAVLLLPRFWTPSDGAAQQEIERLSRENVALGSRLTARELELASQQQQMQKLQAELQAATKASAALRRDGQQQGFRLGQSLSQEARLLEELTNRDKQLAAASEEIGRITQLRVADSAALDAQGAKLRDAFDQLRIATATVEMERQLAAAGRDILDLMRARQLRVVDVRDTDANGRPLPAFARVFVAEGRSIRMFAFDMNEGRSLAATRFQVWGEQVGDAASLRNLGSLNVDDRTQNRWSLSIQNPDLVKDINSVFVTASSGRGSPDGPRLLYAYLGNTGAP